jgi:CubicO group peptidase (beta-lactamase class C family)
VNAALARVVALTTASLLLSVAHAQASETPQLTAEDASAFLDGMLSPSIAIGDIAGVVVSIVKDDALLVAKGYGFADVEKRVAVSPARTLFRPASISKLFTWTGVMQQVEAGKLDLDGDINQYLDFEIAGYGGQPIKLRHLLTHTAGFEEALLDLLVYEPKDVRPLGEFLKDTIPARIYPPGTVPAYSNYGAALAGYIVARAAGVPFEEYIEQRIFQPLRMNNSTFRQPVPEPLLANLSNGYTTASGEVVPFEYGSDSPAGMLSSTATDMAQFMMAHLNGGALPGGDESTRFLTAETTRLMHSVANQVAPSIDAMAHGFYEQNRNGVRAIAHGGDLTAFHSELVLIPSAKVGLYMSFNSLGKDAATYKLRTALYEAFMDRYFPRRTAAEREPLPADAKRNARAVAGSYELSRRAETSLFSFLYMFGQQEATAQEDGSIEIAALANLNGEPKKLIQVEPWLWQEAHGEARVAALRDSNGDVTTLVPHGYGPIFVFQRTRAWRSKAWLQPAILVAGLVLAVAVVARFVGLLRRRFKRTAVPVEAPAGDRRLQRLAWAAPLACLLFALCAGLIVAMLSGDSYWLLSSGAKPLLRLVQLIALVAVLGAAAAVWVAVAGWRSSVGNRWRAVGRTAVAAACLVWAYVAIAFHFLSLRLHY